MFTSLSHLSASLANTDPRRSAEGSIPFASLGIGSSTYCSYIQEAPTRDVRVST